MASPRILYEDDQYQIRPAKDTDEFRKMWWSFMQGLGWNRGYYDLDTYMNPSMASGMLLLIDKSNLAPVGHVSAVINGNNTGWISMFIIDEKHRGKLMGRPLFKAAMADAERAGVKILGLDAVREQKGTYERRGFVESPLGVVKIMMRPLVSKESLPRVANVAPSSGNAVENIQDVPVNLLVAHELKYTGFERPKLWSQEHTFHRSDVSGFALVSESPPTEVSHIKGWTLTRRCSGGVRIGPVYAEDATSAKSILAAAMESATPAMIKDLHLPNEPISESSEEDIVEKGTIVSEVWCGNPEAEKVFGDFGWKGVGVEYHRMWVDGKATEEWKKGGLAQKGVFAIFDAAVG